MLWDICIISATSEEADTIIDATVVDHHEEAHAGTPLLSKGLMWKQMTEVEKGDELVEYDEIEIEGGARYKGQWKGSIPIARQSQRSCMVMLGRGRQCHGQGVLRRPDGSCYEGNFVNGKRHGQGVFFATADSVYEGEWEEDTKHGRGKYTFEDGSTYDGEWHDDLKEGQGVEAWVDGSKYEGQFLRGIRHGDGIYTSSEGKTSSYKNQFNDDGMP